MDAAKVANVEKMLIGVIAKNCPGDAQQTFKRIETKSGVNLNTLGKHNLEKMLSTVSAELQGQLEEWKIKFVVGILKTLLEKNI